MKNRLRNIGYLCRLKILRLFWESFVKEMTMFSVFFFTNIKSSHWTLKTNKSLAKNYPCELWFICCQLFSFLIALCQPQWPWRGVSVAPGTRSRCECPDLVRQSIIATQSSILWSYVSGVVNLLIKYGADPRLCDSDRQIPLHKVITKLLWFEMNVGWSGFEIVSFLWCFPLFQRNYCQ